MGWSTDVKAIRDKIQTLLRTLSTYDERNTFYGVPNTPTPTYPHTILKWIRDEPEESQTKSTFTVHQHRFILQLFYDADKLLEGGGLDEDSYFDAIGEIVDLFDANRYVASTWRNMWFEVMDSGFDETSNTFPAGQCDMILTFKTL